MRKLFLFMNVSLDGYVEGPNHDLSWSKRDFEAFSTGESGQVDTILLGRKTYEMMKSFWPMPLAQETAPEVARFLNDRLKVVASHSPFVPGWQNVKVIYKDVLGEIRRLKEQPGEFIIILGSNRLCTSLIPAGLIDELPILVNPVALGSGTPLFAGLPGYTKFSVKESRQLKNGTILHNYVPE